MHEMCPLNTILLDLLHLLEEIRLLSFVALRAQPSGDCLFYGDRIPAALPNHWKLCCVRQGFGSQTTPDAPQRDTLLQSRLIVQAICNSVRAPVFLSYMFGSRIGWLLYYDQFFPAGLSWFVRPAQLSCGQSIID